MLRTFPSPFSREQDATVRLWAPVASVCPFDGSPDESTIDVSYRPHELCLEMASFRDYVAGFAGEAISHEALAARVATDLMDALGAGLPRGAAGRARRADHRVREGDRVMRWDVTCPSCGGPAVQETDWMGETITRCDAYARCPERVQRHARWMLAVGWSPRAAIASAAREMDELALRGDLDLIRRAESQGMAA